MGAVIHTLNLRLAPDQLAYIINHAEDAVICVDEVLFPPARQARRAVCRRSNISS